MAISINDFCIQCNSLIPLIRRESFGKQLWIYGAGKGGEILAELLEKSDISVCGFIDRNAGDMIRLNDYRILSIDDVYPQESFVCISLMDYLEGLKVFENLINIGFSDNDVLLCAQLVASIEYEDHEYKGCKVGRLTYGYATFLQWHSFEVESIGRYCSINDTARFVPKHLNYVTTYPLDRKPFNLNRISERDYILSNTNPKVLIGNDVCIGANACILPQVQIGDGACVGAGSIVTKNVMPYEIVGGNPAAHLGFRFSKRIRDALLRIKWWEWDIHTVIDRAGDFSDINKFIDIYDNNKV